MVVEVIDAPWAGVPARFRWFKRRWICRTTWNTVWSHIKPCLRAASDDPARFAGVRVLGVDEHVWHHQDRHRRGPRELTGIVDLTRGEDHPTARLLDLVPGRSGTVHENWLAERGEDFRAGVRIGGWIPSRDRKNGSVRPSWQMRHTSVSTSPTFTGQVREVFHQAIPAQGQRLAVHLIERLPACPIPEIARLGANPTQVEGRLLGLLGYRRSQQRLHGSHQRTLSSWADAPPEATATPPATNFECSSSQEA